MKWKDEDIMKVRYLTDSGFSAREIAAMFQTTPYAVYCMRSKHGITRKLSNNKKALYSRMRYRYDSEFREKQLLRNKAYYRGRNGVVRRKHWLPKDIERLVQLCKEGKTMPEICKELGRTRAAVRGMRGRLGISRPLSEEPRNVKARQRRALIREIREARKNRTTNLTTK